MIFQVLMFYLILFVPPTIAAVIVFWLAHFVFRGLAQAVFKLAHQSPAQYAANPVSRLPGALALIPATAAFFQTMVLLPPILFG